MGRFGGAVAVVTGGSSGIGAATVYRLLAEGARVVVADANLKTLGAMEQELDRRGVGSASRCVASDVSDPASVVDLADQTVAAFGRVDLLVSNAGIWSQRSFLDLELDEWDRVLNVNLRGAFITCQALCRIMARQGEGGAVVITASTNSFLAEPATAHYNASKGALAMLVKSMAVDLAPHRIRVNAIAPGTIRTAINQKLLELGDGPSPDFAFPPLRRWGNPDECASVITFLASHDASYVTGSIYVVDGGQIALNGVTG